MNEYTITTKTSFTYKHEITAESEEQARSIALDFLTEETSSYFNVINFFEDITIKPVNEVKVNLVNIPELPDNVPEEVKQAYLTLAQYVQTSGEDLISSVENAKVRKPTDTTVLTEHQIGVVKSMYALYQLGNLVSVKTTQELTDMLNEMFGLNKSRSAYTKIWTEKDVASTSV